MAQRLLTLAEQLDARHHAPGVHASSLVAERSRVVRAARVPRRQRPQPVHHHRAVPALPPVLGGPPGAAARLRGQPRRRAPRWPRASASASCCASSPAEVVTAASSRSSPRNQNVLADLTEALIGARLPHVRSRGRAPCGRGGLRRAHRVRREELRRPQDRAAGVPGAGRARRSCYRVLGYSGPPHDREFEVEATVDGETLGHGVGQSKKRAEQEAAAETLRELHGARARAARVRVRLFGRRGRRGAARRRPGGRRRQGRVGVSQVTARQGLQVLRQADGARVRARGRRRHRPQRQRQEQPLRGRRVGPGRAEPHQRARLLHAGRHLRRQRRPARGCARRGRAHLRQRGRRPAAAHAGGRHQPPCGPRRRVQYAINRTTCRLTDVVELMAGIGLGKELHSIVSQGKVESFLQSKPEDRRALIEEAAGLGRFKRRRERSELKLREVRRNLERVEVMEREVATQLAPLRRQASAAEQLRAVEHEIAELRGRLLVGQLDELDGQLGGTAPGAGGPGGGARRAGGGPGGDRGSTCRRGRDLHARSRGARTTCSPGAARTRAHQQARELPAADRAARPAAGRGRERCPG